MKYKLTDETKTTELGVVLRRICALGEIRRWGVCKGDIGGWIESESNLSQDGDAWISENAMVYDDAQVSGNAMAYGDAQVRGNARVYDDAQVYGDAEVYGYALVRGNAVVSENADIFGNAEICGNARVGGRAEIIGYAVVSENAKVYGNARVGGYARVGGDANIIGNAQVYGDAVVCSSADYAVFKNFWSSYRWFTYTRSNKMWKVGCFYGTGEELIKKAYADSEKSGRCYEAIVRAVEAILSATAGE